MLTNRGRLSLSMFYLYWDLPFLTFAYYRLEMKEEREVSEEFPELYAAYRKVVPAFVETSNLKPHIYRIS